jgi:hypothetical protein
METDKGEIMSKMGEYAASMEGRMLPGGITIGAIEPIAVGTMVNIPGIGEAQIQEALPYGNYKVVTTDVQTEELFQTNVFIVKPVQDIKWYVIRE